MPFPLCATLMFYTRFDATAVVRHPARAAILDRLRDTPGATVSDLAREVHVDYKTAAHHVRMLARHRLLRVTAAGRLRRCYLPGAPLEMAPPPRVVLALRAVAEGAAGPAALGRALGVARGSAGSLLAGLARGGFIERDRSGWRLTPAARRLLGLPARIDAAA